MGGIAACGDDSTGTQQGSDVDALFSDVVTPDGGGDSTPTDTAQVAKVRKLDFDDAFGDDQVPCKGTDRCTISISFSATRTLKVVYTEDGSVKAGQVVKFAIENDANNLGFLNTLSSFTDESGISLVETKARSEIVGQYVVKAYIDNSDIPPLYFDVVVTSKGTVPLTVLGTYGGSRPVGVYSVRLYRQDAANKPDCSNMLDLFTNQTAAQARDNLSLTQSAKFPEFDGLEQDGTQRFTALVFSLNQANAIQAWGCNATEVVVEVNKSKTVSIEMTDRPPLYAGSYDITSRFDFISAIPEPYKKWVDYVVGFFQSPTQTVFELACDLLGGFDNDQLEGFCGSLFSRDGDGNVTPGTLGAFVFDLVDQILESFVQGTVFGDVLQAGGDVADILKAFEIQATLTFNAEPSAAGEWSEADTSENWHTVKVKWSLGANCDPATEAGCGSRQFSINAFQQQAITGHFGASVANYWDLTIEKHPLNLRYGALINYFLENFLLPVVVGNDNVNSYEELLGYMVGGGVECLAPAQGALDCCGRFADGLAPGTTKDGVISESTEVAIQSACNIIATTGSGFLRNTLNGLDANSGNVFSLGTKQTCKLSDFNNDMVVDGVGSQAAPCKWDVELNLGSNPTKFDAIFWGGRAQ
ncbi:MAG: hypothetical protein H6745_03085 [Deltaproteobacteria bacterium]|nr:hypothetical protein [Deltaproteobacteria bacterium]